MIRPVSIYGVTVLVSDAGEVWTTSRTVTTERCAQGSDYFTVSAGPWTLTFDNRKESEVKW